MDLLHPLVEEWDADLRGSDPLGFPGYTPPGPEGESVLTGCTESYALIQGRFDVMGGSMGAAHGERVVRAYRRAVDLRLPVVVVTSSGGARMQEGMVSLIQMGRTAAAARAHSAAGLLSVALHRSPTTGGVLASYSSLADVRGVVAGATIGFAGPRVVELTTGEPLPPTSHTAEGAHSMGLVDEVVPAAQQREWVEAVLGLRDRPLDAGPFPTPVAIPGDDAWANVLRSRAVGRPSGLAWAAALTRSWIPLNNFDPAFVAGLATLRSGRRVVVVGMERGGPRPAGYRLAQRAFAMAGRLGLPVVTLVDTPGADAAPASESRGIAQEIARTFSAMAGVPTPTVSVIVGEGGSGGALAIAVADRLFLLEGAVLSVIRPEGAAAILDRDTSAAPERAEHLKLRPADMVSLGIADGVLPDGDVEAVSAAVERALDEAVVGDRLRRWDEATARWLRHV